jgi:hypothetical protein
VLGRQGAGDALKAVAQAYLSNHDPMILRFHGSGL